MLGRIWKELKGGNGSRYDHVLLYTYMKFSRVKKIYINYEYIKVPKVFFSLSH